MSSSKPLEKSLINSRRALQPQPAPDSATSSNSRHLHLRQPSLLSTMVATVANGVKPQDRPLDAILSDMRNRYLPCLARSRSSH